MRATVDVLEEDVKVPYQKFVKKKLFGGDVYETAYSEERRHVVSTLVELTEEELAIIRNYGFSTQLLDDSPAHTAEEIQSMQEAQEQSTLLQHKDPAVRQFGWDGVNEFMDKYKAERDRTSVADLLQRPLRREFIKPIQAAQYADRIKTRILPALSTLLKKHANVPKSETLEF